MEQFCKEQFWENAMKTLVRDILYRDKNEENRLRTDVYPYDIVKMAEDVKDFYKTVTDAGMEVSTSAMAGFLVYTEWKHLGDKFSALHPDDKSQLFALAAAINQELEEPCYKSGEAWYTEAWYDADLEDALEELGVPVTAENIRRLRKSCKGLFDDHSERNELILEKASEIFEVD